MPQHRSDLPTICYCCGRPGASTPVSGGRMHFACWEEHHSDPTGEWPVGHECALAPQSTDSGCEHDSFDSRALGNGALRQTCNDCGAVCDTERAD